MSKEELLQAFAEAYEQLMRNASEVLQQGGQNPENKWGPREVVAHLAGWEAMATVRIPRIVGGMRPLEEPDAARQEVMNDAINNTIVTMIGDQSFNSVCGILRQVYQQNLVMLRQLDVKNFQPGEYVYERTRAVIDHCHDHSEKLLAVSR